jgi:hypothetical protein
MPETESKPGQQLTIIRHEKPVRTPARVAASIVVPAILADAGDRAAKRFLEFFAATIRNKSTRMAYRQACCRLFDWCAVLPEASSSTPASRVLT